MTGRVPMGWGPESAVPAAPAAGLPRRTPSWAAREQGADPVDELARRMGVAVAGAVHAEEIAALLESEGLTDEQITGRYRHPDLFSLAETLHARVPRAFPEPEPPADPWRTGVTRCVLRGLTFALPGVAYVLGGRWAGGPDGPFGVTAAVAGWAVAALVSWGWNQGLAHRAGLLLLAGRHRDAARCLLLGGGLGAVLAAAAALTLTGTARPAPPLFALGQALYMAAATTVLVLGKERLLLHVLAPLTVAAACGAADLPSPVLASGLTTTVLAALWAAAHTARRAGATSTQDPNHQGRGAAFVLRLRRAGASSTQDPNHQGRGDLPELAPGRCPRRADPRRRFASPRSEWGSSCRRRITRSWRVARAVPRAPSGRSSSAGGRPQLGARVGVRESVAMGLGGLAAGVLVVAAALAGELVAALSVSMGVAEWLLFRFRGRCLLALRGTAVAERFAARSGRVLARCLGAYAAALMALAAVEAAVLPGAAAWNATRLAVPLALGCALWLALLLQSCGRPWTAASVLSAAAATVLVLLAAHTGTPDAVLGLAGAAATAVLLAAAAAVTARVTTHR